MRRFTLSGLITIFFASFCHGACDPTLTPTHTTNIGLAKPAINSCSWGTQTNANWDIIDSSLSATGSILNSTNTFTGTNTFSDVVVKAANYYKLTTSVGTPFIAMQTGAGLGFQSIAINPVDGIGFGINNSYVSGYQTGQGPYIGIGSPFGGVYGSWGIFGSSNNATGTYSGFIGTSSVDQSVLWTLPKKDGGSNQPIVTNGSANLSFLALSANQCVQTNSSGGLATTGSSCGSGGGGGTSVLQVTNSGVQVTSPTASINFNGQGFLTASAGTTAYISLNPATTDFIQNRPASAQNASINVSGGILTSTIAISNNSSSYYGEVITATGTKNALRVVERGLPDAIQSIDGGAVNITVDSNTVAPALVLVSSSPDVQLGSGIFELWQQSPDHNDPQFWIHAVDHNSAGNIRVDSYAPNFEIVNLSTDNVHGFGKWEPFATAYQSARMQAGSSRCYDNSGFDNEAYWEPMSKGGGLYLSPFDSTGCEASAGVGTSSATIGIHWLTLNGHDVGIRGPDNTAASWTFRLPSTFSNGGQVMYQATSSGARNWEFTTGGVAGYPLLFQGTSSAPIWSNTFTSTMSVLTTVAANYEMTFSTTASFYHVAVSTNGHLNVNGTPPVVSSCGTSPVIAGSDNAFTITVGATTTSCTISFKVPFNSTPTCVVSDQTQSLVNALSYSVTASAVTLSQTALGGSKLDVHCLGRD